MRLTDTDEFQHILNGLNGAKLDTRYVRVFDLHRYHAVERQTLSLTVMTVKNLRRLFLLTSTLH